MKKPHSATRLSWIGKRAAPSLSRILNRYPFRRFITLLSWFLAFVQGKGAGTGWDRKGEQKAASTYIRRPQPVVFDVGANTGEWSKAILENLGDEYRLFQIEPTQHCCEILRALNSPNTTVIQAAAGETKGTATMFLPFPGSGIASLHARRDSYFQKYEYTEEKVQVARIDDILEEHQIDIVDLMKIDTEGHDLAVLHGAKQALSSKRILALTFEFGSGNINSRTFFHDFWDLLHPYGYQIERICPGGVLFPIEEYYEDLEYFRGVSNYVAHID